MSRISLVHPLLVSLIWMFRWNRKVILDIEYELLFDYFEWFFCNLTLDYPCEESIDILLSCFKAHYFFVVFYNGKRRIKRSDIGVFVFTIVPGKTSFFCFIFGERKIIICHRFIVPERGELGWEEFAPFTGCLHMVDDFPNSFLVFFGRIWLIAYAVLLVPETDAPEAILTGEALLRIEEIPGMEDVETVEDIAHLDSSECFETPRRVDIHIRRIHQILPVDSYVHVFTVLRIRNIVALNAIFGIDDEISDAVFGIQNLSIFDGESTCVFMEIFVHFPDHGCIAQFRFSDFFLVFILRKWLVLKMVFFSDEIRTHETIAASGTVFHEVTITAIFGVCRIITSETFLTIETLVEHL